CKQDPRQPIREVHMKRLRGYLGYLIVGVVMLTVRSGSVASDMTLSEDRYVERTRRTHYLTDNHGNVVLDVPTPVLRSVRDQISAKGDAHTLKALEDLYDFETGHVRDEAHARNIDQLLKVRGKEKQP